MIWSLQSYMGLVGEEVLAEFWRRAGLGHSWRSGEHVPKQARGGVGDHEAEHSSFVQGVGKLSSLFFIFLFIKKKFFF